MALVGVIFGWIFAIIFGILLSVVVAFAVGALAMIGVPPTCGFFSKWYLILGCIDAEAWAFVGVIMVSSLGMIGYFGRRRRCY